MSLMTETFTLQRRTLARDTAGGATYRWQDVAAGLIATRNYYRHSSVERVEQGDHGAQGPAISVDRRQFLTFLAPFPDVRAQDQIVAADGTAYLVLFTRAYTLTLQVDVEVIQ